MDSLAQKSPCVSSTHVGKLYPIMNGLISIVLFSDLLASIFAVVSRVCRFCCFCFVCVEVGGFLKEDVKKQPSIFWFLMSVFRSVFSIFSVWETEWWLNGKKYIYTLTTLYYKRFQLFRKYHSIWYKCLQSAMLSNKIYLFLLCSVFFNPIRITYYFIYQFNIIRTIF